MGRGHIPELHSPVLSHTAKISVAKLQLNILNTESDSGRFNCLSQLFLEKSGFPRMASHQKLCKKANFIKGSNWESKAGCGQARAARPSTVCSCSSGQPVRSTWSWSELSWRWWSKWSWSWSWWQWYWECLSFENFLNLLQCSAAASVSLYVQLDLVQCYNLEHHHDYSDHHAPDDQSDNGDDGDNDLLQ